MQLETECPNEAFTIIPTLDGNMVATKGDYIIKGVNGEFIIVSQIYSL